MTGHSGPFPVIPADAAAPGDHTSDVQVVGRDVAPVVIDQPRGRRCGSWVRRRWRGGRGRVRRRRRPRRRRPGRPSTTAVVHDRRHRGDRRYAALPRRRRASCRRAAQRCVARSGSPNLPPRGVLRNPGLIWLTRADLRSLAADGADAFVVTSCWRTRDRARVRRTPVSRSRRPLPPGDRGRRHRGHGRGRTPRSCCDRSVVARGRPPTATLAVLVGGRMADQTRRVGLLKAVGGTPVLVAVRAARRVRRSWRRRGRGGRAAVGCGDRAAGSPAPSAGPARQRRYVVDHRRPPSGLVTGGGARSSRRLATVVPAVRAARTSTVRERRPTRPATTPHRLGRSRLDPTAGPLLLAVRSPPPAAAGRAGRGKAS